MSWLLWGETNEAIQPIKPILKICKPEDDPDMISLSKLLDQVDLGTSKLSADVKEGPRALAWKTRFLIAACGDPELAAKKIREMLAERDKNGLDNYLSWRIKRIRKASRSFPFNIFYGHTKQGVPLSISIMGTSDIHKAQQEILKAYPKEVLDSTDHGELTVEWLKKGYLHQLEHLYQVISVQASKKAGRDIYDCVTIVDLKDFGLAQVVTPIWVCSFISFICNCESVLYPGLNGQSFVINCNSYFTTAWKVISTFLPQTILDNIQILGEDWQEHLKDILDFEKLPPVLGGKGPNLFEHPSYRAWLESTRDIGVSPSDEENKSSHKNIEDEPEAREG